MRGQSSALRPGQAAVTVIPKFFMILYLRKRHHHPLSVHGGFLLGPAVHRLVPGDEGWLKYNAAKVRWLMIFSIRLSSQGSHSLYFSRRSAKYSGLALSISYNSSYISGHFQRFLAVRRGRDHLAVLFRREICDTFAEKFLVVVNYHKFGLHFSCLRVL